MFDLFSGMEATEAGVWKLFMAVAIHRWLQILNSNIAHLTFSTVQQILDTR